MIGHFSPIWQELVTTAMVGTGRKPPQIPTYQGAPAALLEKIDTSSPEDTLLSSAAIVSLYERAGQIPPMDTTTSVPEPAPLDDKPCCSLQATRHLNIMLTKSYKDILPEWLAVLNKAGQRVSETMVIELLEEGRKHTHLREAIVQAVGKRGAWLATQNDAWAYAAMGAIPSEEANYQDIWETGKTDQRVTLLQNLRYTNPSQARELLLSTWKTEKAADRRKFLQILDEKLSMDDEPFLEDALSDRSKDVRAVALSLLVKLPASRLHERIREQVAPMLTLKKKLMGHAIEVVIPDDVDEKALQRDGIETSVPRYYKGGEKAWLLSQMLQFVQPSFWYEQWDIPPAKLIQAAKKSDWEEVLLDGWLKAARHFNDIVFLEALFPVFLKQSTSEFLRLFVDKLPQEQLEVALITIINEEKQPLNTKHTAWRLLKDYTRPWGYRLARTVMESLFQRIWKHDHSSRQDKQDYWFLKNSIKDFALYMPPDMAAEIAYNKPTNADSWHHWEVPIKEILAILNFRQEMLKEF